MLGVVLGSDSCSAFYLASEPLMAQATLAHTLNLESLSALSQNVKHKETRKCQQPQQRERKSGHRSLTLPMLKLLSSKAKGCKDFGKPSKTCHVGIHWKALTEYSQMSTNIPGFQSFFQFFASFLYWPN